MLVLSLRKKHSSCLSNKVLPCTGGQEPISPSLMKTEKIPDCMWKHFHKLFMIWKRDKSNQHYCCIAVMTVCAICKSGITAKISFLFSWGKLQGWAEMQSWDAELSCRAELQTVALLWFPGSSCSGCTNWLPRHDFCSKVTNLYEQTSKSQIVLKLHQMNLPGQKCALLHKLCSWLT